MNDDQLYQWQMIAKDKDFELSQASFPEIEQGSALVEVAGCGVCHTDLSFWHYGVKTKHELPLTLGHEISGTVIRGPEQLIGKKVIVPAVIPCGNCSLCNKGRSNICQNQQMPGNDFHGGFASHVKVPARFLCIIPERVLALYSLRQLAVIADAVSTPYQVVKKAEISPGDFVIIIGLGGIGIYAAQLAKLKGAIVLGIDVDDQKLGQAKKYQIDAVLNVRDMEVRQVLSKVREEAEILKVFDHSRKIFEMSGTKSGQELGYSLLTYASVLSIVGFTRDKLEIRLSNLMAYDATIIGTWGCKPELYSEVLDLVGKGQLEIGELVQEFPMSEINKVFRDSLEIGHSRRPILVPDFVN